MPAKGEAVTKKKYQSVPSGPPKEVKRIKGHAVMPDAPPPTVDAKFLDEFFAQAYADAAKHGEQIWKKGKNIPLTIPYNYEPRPYQEPFLRAMDVEKKKRAVLVWNRRSGKDKTAFNYMIREAFRRVGSYFYFFPTYAQGRKIIWDGMDRDGFKFLDHIPESLREKTNATEMKVLLTNGSLIQIVGSDNVDSIVGTNPIGCIFSEYALQDPLGWDYIRPILRENGGWAIFPYTPRGKNHGFDLYDSNKDNPEWFCQVLTIKDTGVLTDQDVEDEIRQGMDPDLAQQEFYCSWEAAMQGAYFAQQLKDARDQGRITNVPYHPGIPVDTWWDLGYDDSMSIWFSQNVGREVHFLYYFEGSGEGFAYYMRELDRLKQQRGWVYGTHTAPHDIEVGELGTGKSRKDAAKEMGLNFSAAPKPKFKEDAIEACRNIFPICWFDKMGCRRGIDCLASYQKEWNEKNKVFMQKPKHNWACLSGETMIRTLDGWHRIDELVGKEFYVWGYDTTEHRLVPAKAGQCWNAKRTNLLAVVTLDDGTKITCTPDHRFMTRDEGWICAGDLVVGTSLMPFYERTEGKREYMKVHLNDGSITDEHKFVYNRFNGRLLADMHIHHVDGNKLNNNPENLRQLTIAEHMSIHSSEPERLAKFNKNSCRTGNPKSAAILISVNKLRSGDNHHTRDPKYWTEEMRKKISDGSIRSHKSANRKKQCIGCGEEFTGDWLRLYCCERCKRSARRTTSKIRISELHDDECRRASVANHKVVSVEIELSERDVYDISVPGINNFVAGGVVVHNCHGADSFQTFAITHRFQQVRGERGRWRPNRSRRI